jgi:hypothetical protein
MEQLPKIVGQRLRAVSAKTHPDANLLAAFAEKSLFPREQAQVVEHLANCAVCRDVLAQSQPEEALQTAAVAAPGRRDSWFHSATVRWAALAACVAVVGAVVISRSRFESKPGDKIALYKQPVEAAKTESVTAPVAAPAEPVATRREESKAAQLQDRLEAGRKRDTNQVAGLEKRQLAMAAPKSQPEQSQVGGNSAELDAKQKVSSTNETVEVSSAAVQVETQTVDEAKANKKEFSADKAMKAPARNEVELPQTVAALPAAPQAKGGPMSSVVSNRPSQSGSVEVNGLYRAKDGYADSGASAGALRSGVRFPTPRWQLSPEGKLLRSADLGESWQRISLGENVAFRALSVNGREVWVGGSRGNLFYSPNAGESWQEIKPSSNGQTLTADITGIEFKDPQHGKVTTADHQIWTTTDGGHTWSIEAR